MPTFMFANNEEQYFTPHKYQISNLLMSNIWNIPGFDHLMPVMMRRWSVQAPTEQQHGTELVEDVEPLSLLSQFGV